MSDARRLRDRRALILLFLAGLLAVQVHWLFGVLALWIIILGQLEHRGVLDRIDATRVLGGILMVRTRRGQRALEKLAKPRLAWRIFGEISLWTCALSMAVIILFLLLSFGSAILFGVPKAEAPPSQLILIPGVNPVIPFWWPLIAIIGALVIHEYGHALQARAHGMRVRSFGLLMLGPLPLGAFAEPEAEELFKAPRRERARMFAAGPSINIYAALFTWLLIGALATQFAAADPGVHASAIIEGTPADEAGLEPWEIITHLNGTAVTTSAEMSDALASHSAGETVQLDVLSRPDADGVRVGRTVELVLADKYEYHQQQNISEEDLASSGIEKGDAFLGVSGMAGGTSGIDRLAGPDLPWWGDMLYTPVQIFVIISTPIQNEGQIMDPHEMDYLEADGLLGNLLGIEVMLALITCLFWFVWMNLGLGFANLIPMIPFDGGHLMKDFISNVVERLNKFSKAPHPLKVEPIVNRISSMSSMLLLFGLLALMIAQYI